MAGEMEVYRFCHICDKVTVHKRATALTPYTCREKHDMEKASKMCAHCGKELDERTTRIAKGLSANSVFCSNCNTAEHW